MSAPDWDGEIIDVNNLPTSWISGNRALNVAEMANNAAMFTQYFAVTLDQRYTIPYVWSPEAVAAMLGNMVAESTINPGRWQNGYVPEYPDTSDEETGYGLVQWTPFSKYRDWAGDDWQDNGEKETKRIVWEMENGAQWMSLSQFNDMSFRDFAASELEPEYLANVFLRSYERPADPDGTQQTREKWARYWYESVVKPIYERNNNLWYWLFPYIFNRNFYMGRLII